MLYLDYAKSTTNGYIMNFFADSEEDIIEISNRKRFITKNGTDYGVPQPSSTVVITMPDKTKRTYVLDESGEWQQGGVDMDYSKLENAPIILANLADKDFIPEANTYYEHLGETTGDFIKGIIYFYDGTEYKAIDGSGSGRIQPDYNQNDSTAPDYIKNRPFYEEQSLIEVADFKVISGNLEEEGSEIIVEHNGERYAGTVSLTSDGYSFDTGVLGKDDFVFDVTIMDKITNCTYYHKKTYEIKANDEVVFNGIKYFVKLITSGGAAGKLYISDGEVNFESGDTISASFIYVFKINENENGLILDNYIIYKPTTNIDFNLKINHKTIKTIDQKFINIEASNNNVLILEGKKSLDTDNIIVKVSSQQEGLEILNSFKNGYVIRVSLYGSDRVGNVVYCEDYTSNCSGLLSYAKLYAIFNLGDSIYDTNNLPSIVGIKLMIG